MKTFTNSRILQQLGILLAIFLSSGFVYLFFATKFTFHPRWAFDYFNPLAHSLLQGKLNLVAPPITYDLAFYNNKWYAPWGILSALFLIPIQLFKHRYIPTIYETIFFASLNIVVVYMLLQRVKQDFFPKMSQKAIMAFLALFAFGTTHFYVGTLGGVWHVDQMVTSFFPTLGIYFIFKKDRKIIDYLLSSLFCCMSLLGKPTQVLILTLPIILSFYDFFTKEKITTKSLIQQLIKIFFLFFVPLALFTGWFLTYNFLRFQNPFEYGYDHIHENPYLAQIRKANGSFSLKNLPTNIRYMIFEIPGISFERGIQFHFNQKGNSIFFLTPAFLAIFLAWPIYKEKKRIATNPYLLTVWTAAIVTIIPTLLLYSTGWVQFGYRYTLDITVLLLLLIVFGMKGKVNWVFLGAVIFSIAMYCIGIISFL